MALSIVVIMFFDQAEISLNDFLFLNVHILSGMKLVGFYLSLRVHYGGVDVMCLSFN